MIEAQITTQTKGSIEGQISNVSLRIQGLVAHLKEHKNDRHSHRGLLMLVGKRRRLLAYLKKKSPDRYQDLIEQLGLRVKRQS